MNDDNQNITKREFWGLAFGVFSFLFVIHMAYTIKIAPWFHGYVMSVIVFVQIICLYNFVKYFKK